MSVGPSEIGLLIRSSLSVVRKREELRPVAVAAPSRCLTGLA